MNDDLTEKFRAKLIQQNRKDILSFEFSEVLMKYYLNDNPWENIFTNFEDINLDFEALDKIFHPEYCVRVEKNNLSIPSKLDVSRQKITEKVISQLRTNLNN